MIITQTVEIPASRRITIEVPREIPEGQAILTFEPIPTKSHVPNAVTMAALQETSDIMSGKVPGKWHRFSSEENSREELRNVLKKAMQEDEDN